MTIFDQTNQRVGIQQGMDNHERQQMLEIVAEKNKEIESLRLELAVCRDTIKPYVENCSRLAADTIKQQEEIESLRMKLELTSASQMRAIGEKDEWKRLAGARQARIDALMFEFCPDDMTADQIAEYEKQQRKVEDMYDPNP